MNRTSFVIYSQGRTGSALVTSLLNSHPQVHCYGELFHPNAWQGQVRNWLRPFALRYPMAYITARIRLTTCPAVGFRLLINQNEKLSNLLARLSSTGWKVIHLQRRDLVQRSLSAAVLRTTGLSHSLTHSATSPDKISVDPALFLHILRKGMQMTAQEVTRLENIPHLTLGYETDLAEQTGWAMTTARLLEYLNLPATQLNTDLVKTWTQPYSELIANYADLMEALRCAGYSELLTRPDALEPTRENLPR